MMARKLDAIAEVHGRRTCCQGRRVDSKRMPDNPTHLKAEVPERRTCCQGHRIYSKRKPDNQKHLKAELRYAGVVYVVKGAA